MMNILDSFPKHMTPREFQKDVLEQIENAWSSTDVFVINAPTAFGKTAVAITIANYARTRMNWSSSIITPTNVLVEQYLEHFPWLGSVKRKDRYFCESKVHLNPVPKCIEVKKMQKKHCAGCPYVQDLRGFRGRKISVMNNHQYLAHRLYREILISDEAHNLVSMRKELAARKVWADDIGLPSTITTYKKLTGWLNWKKASGLIPAGTPLDKLHRELNSGGEPKYLVQYVEDEPYHKYTRPCLKLLPVDVSEEPSSLWPQGQVNKIFLLSATIGEHDVEQLGLSRKRVTFVESTSPIAPERRPVHQHFVGSMAVRQQEENLHKVVDKISSTALQYPKDKGLVHITYSLRDKLKPLLEASPIADRLMWHSRSDKMLVYKKFKDSPVTEGKILMASGLYEGIDLPNDAGRWQIVTKIPWPSLGEPALAYMAEKHPKRYAWETIKVVLQACGRICRTPTDWGDTYIIDSTFERLFKENQELFPYWFTSALIRRET